MPNRISHEENGFYRPIAVDDWGNIGYYLEAIQSDWGTWSHQDQDQAQRLRAGDHVEVRWPDGTKSGSHTIVGRGQTNSVYDSGHSYGVPYEALFVQVDVHGVKVFIPITELYVRRDESSAREKT